MTVEELIDTLQLFTEERLENLPEGARGVFDAIMRLADERDELREKVKLLNKQKEELYEKYCKILKENEEWFRARTAIEMMDLLDLED